MNALKAWDSLTEFGQIPADTTVVKGEPIFPRLEMEEEVEFIKDLKCKVALQKKNRRKK